MKIKNNAERVAEALVVLCVLLACVALLAAVGRDVHATYNDNEYLERRVWELERALAQYTDAAGVIVVRNDGQCARDWWFAGEALGCGTAWGRFRMPVQSGTAYDPVTGARTPIYTHETVQYGTQPGQRHD